MKISNDELLSDLKRVSVIFNGRYFSVRDYQSKGQYNHKTVVARFGSWSSALKSADVIHYPDDLIHKRFGSLTVIKRTDDKKNNYYLWECLCDCGKYTYTNQTQLKRKHVVSCGCQRGIVMRDRKRLANEVLSGYEIDGESGLRYPDFDKKLLSTNTSGYTGIYKSGNTWTCELIVKGVRHRQRGFKTADEAYLGRLKLEEEYLPEHFKKRLDERRKKNEV